MTTTEEVPAELRSILRCANCAEPVTYVTTPEFEGWRHHSTVMADKVGSENLAKIIVVQEALDPTACYDPLGLIEAISGSYDGPWDSETRSYSTKQGLINSYKARDGFLLSYCADEMRPGETWFDLLYRPRRYCGCTSCEALLRTRSAVTLVQRPRRSGGSDDSPVYA